LDGLLAFDNAISKPAAQTKGIYSAVAGDPDILLASDLEAGEHPGKANELSRKRRQRWYSSR
jgi:phosphotransacetylase